MGPISLPPCSSQHSWKSSSCPDSWTSCAPRPPFWPAAGQAGGAGGGAGAGTQHGRRAGALSAKGGSWVSLRRCSGIPCRSWRTRCRGPGGRCWGSAGREPPTEAPTPSPGRPRHQVLLSISASMGASAAQEWGVPRAPSPEEHLPRSVRGR